MSVIGGWQRGGWLTERLVWVAVGVVLVAGAHLLPALLQESPRLLRATGSVLWAACLATACYGHATFFVFSMSHAGEARATALATRVNSPVSVPAPVRSWDIADARADVVAKLARLNALRCAGHCETLRVRRAELAAKLAALDVQAEDARREQAWADWQMERNRRALARQDAARDDPVTSRISMWLGVGTGTIDLAVGLVFSLVLEGFACLCWFAAMRPEVGPQSPALLSDAASARVDPVSAPDRVSPHDGALTPQSVSDPEKSMTASADPVAVSDDGEFLQLLSSVAAGSVRPTVTGIRQHLRCSQARASALRRRIVAASPNIATASYT
ncbi:hypothetical protein [Caballeronia sp. LZ034LL]|uniref:hypothetical protein n=1 Tax=Caballeronia sp. LZ034LL TaxID=3038567 RepID=UPI0028660B38|nr:hypothetical protein [Caballeronia sp. LZ034LL]MDR5835383.1 hypothetical protein [Caballeronia sp. LZ034LL]